MPTAEVIGGAPQKKKPNLVDELTIYFLHRSLVPQHPLAGATRGAGKPSHRQDAGFSLWEG